MPKKDRKKIALWLLRFGLGLFLLLWGFDKIFAPDATVKIFNFFYKTPIDVNIAVYLGIAQVIFSILLIAGVKKKFTYPIALVMHGISTVSSYKQLLNPFGPNHLFIAALPVLFAFITLYMLGHEDTMWSWDDR